MSSRGVGRRPSRARAAIPPDLADRGARRRTSGRPTARVVCTLGCSGVGHGGEHRAGVGTDRPRAEGARRDRCRVRRGSPVVQQGARTHKSCDGRDAGRVIGIGRTRPGGWTRSRIRGLADAAGDPSRNRGSTGSEDGVVVERRRRRDGRADGAAPTRRDGVCPGGGRGTVADVAAGRVRGRVPTVAIARPPACQRVPRAVPSRLRWRDRRGRAPRARRRLHDGRRFPGRRIRRSPHCADRLPAGTDSRRGGSSDQCFGPTPKSNDATTACRTRTRSALCRLRRDRPPRVRPRPGMGAER